MSTSHDHDITNADRAERCHGALRQYGDACDVRSNLIDFLTNARHWCDQSGESYSKLDRIAYQHYAAEAACERGRP